MTQWTAGDLAPVAGAPQQLSYDGARLDALDEAPEVASALDE